MPLTGLIFDSTGRSMSPVKARRKGGATYRYYVSTALLVGDRAKVSAGMRAPAQAVEDIVVNRLRRLDLVAAAAEGADWEKARQVIERVTICEDRLFLAIAGEAINQVGDTATIQRRLPDGTPLRRSMAASSCRRPCVGNASEGARWRSVRTADQRWKSRW